MTIPATGGSPEPLVHAPQPVDLTGIETKRAVDWFRTIALIRCFESIAEPLVTQGRIPGGMHSAAGQEATAVGVISALHPTDIVTGTHRSHHITLAKGIPPREVMAELYGKATGVLGGRGGHMHLADVNRGHFGSNGIVGAGLGIAMGAALAAAVAGRGQVAVGYFGDGGSNTGRVWEFVNLAAAWSLPLVVVCENNLYAVETPFHASTAGADIRRRAAAFGLPAERVDGQDVAAMFRTTQEAVSRARAGDGPTFIEAMTYRLGGHDVGDRETYREREEVERWRVGNDPLARLRHTLEVSGALTSTRADEIESEVAASVAEAVEFAETSDYPDATTAGTHVTAMDLKIRGNV